MLNNHKTCHKYWRRTAPYKPQCNNILKSASQLSISASIFTSTKSQFYTLTMGRGAYDTAITPNWMEMLEKMLKGEKPASLGPQKKLEAKVAAERRRRDIWNYKHGFDGSRATVAEREGEEKRKQTFLEEARLLQPKDWGAKPKPPPKPRVTVLQRLRNALSSSP